MDMPRVASFFTGSGGIDIAFEQAGFEIVYANEVDPYPARIYDLNHAVQTDVRSIEEVRPEEVPEADIYILGFPCTDISLAGYRQGLFNDDGTLTRSGLYFEALRLIHANHPRQVFIENVSNLVGHNNGETFQTIYDSLTDEGYHIRYQVLNSMHYGNIAQNRERIYICCFLDQRECDQFRFPNPIPLENTVRDIIDFESQVDDRYYYTPGKYKGDIYEKLEEAMRDDDINDPAVYQWRRKYVRRNQSGVIPCLTANQGGGGHNVCLIKTTSGIRKMTPRECFNAQGYPQTYVLPENMSDSRLYKAAGNSVVIPVVRRLAEEILRVTPENLR